MMPRRLATCNDPRHGGQKPIIVNKTGQLISFLYQYNFKNTIYNFQSYL